MSNKLPVDTDDVGSPTPFGTELVTWEKTESPYSEGNK
jgi:hypothetical protein